MAPGNTLLLLIYHFDRRGILMACACPVFCCSHPTHQSASAGVVPISKTYPFQLCTQNNPWLPLRSSVVTLVQIWLINHPHGLADRMLFCCSQKMVTAWSQCLTESLSPRLGIFLFLLQFPDKWTHIPLGKAKEGSQYISKCQSKVSLQRCLTFSPSKVWK